MEKRGVMAPIETDVEKENKSLTYRRNGGATYGEKGGTPIEADVESEREDVRQVLRVAIERVDDALERFGAPATAAACGVDLDERGVRVALLGRGGGGG